jgi:hypothetical protein
METLEQSTWMVRSTNELFIRNLISHSLLSRSICLKESSTRINYSSSSRLEISKGGVVDLSLVKAYFCITFFDDAHHSYIEQMLMFSTIKARFYLLYQRFKSQDILLLYQ